MKRRQKSRMLVNDSSGWPSPAHNRHSQVCLAPDNAGAGGVWGGSASAVLTAGHPAMSPHKSTPLLAPSSSLGLDLFFSVLSFLLEHLQL